MIVFLIAFCLYVLFFLFFLSIFYFSMFFFFFSSRRRHTRYIGDWSSDVCSSDLPGGTITVTISQEKDETNSWAKLTVQDQGLGIPAEEVSHIFEPFYRASNVLNNIAGTGIGLASVAQIVEQHGGTITVKSKECKGTTFTIHLPLMKLATTEYTYFK